MRITDGNWELLSHDEALGRTVWRMYDGEKVHYRTDYRVEKIIEDNKRHLLDSAGKPWGDWQRVASVPLNTFYDQLAPAVEQDDQKHISKFLNNSDFAKFRTKEGRV